MKNTKINKLNIIKYLNNFRKQIIKKYNKI